MKKGGKRKVWGAEGRGGQIESVEIR